MIKVNKYLISLLFIITVSCTVQRTSFIGNWHETELEFSNSISFTESGNLLGIITSNKWCCGEISGEQFEWLRKSENLWSTFNTLKKTGLTRFISQQEYNQKLFEDDHFNYDWEGLSLNQIVDSLIITYAQNQDTSSYYTKFWKRRKLENNHQMVLKILQETDSIFNNGSIPLVDEISINPKLDKLIKLNIELLESDSLSKTRKTLEYFDYLRSTGLEHSAYNLIFETGEHQKPHLNKDSLLKTLLYDTIPEERYWSTRNNAQWIKSYRDNGP